MNNMLVGLNLWLLCVAGSAIVLFLGYPLILRMLQPLRRVLPTSDAPFTPRVTLLTVVRNGEFLIAEKIRNCLALEYPRGSLEILVVSDGSTDGTEEKVAQIGDERIRLIKMPGHRGKRECINAILPQCTGEIVVLSDADSILFPDALVRLMRHFGDPAIGGVCGQRIIAGSRMNMTAVQQDYITIDSTIKRWETRCGSITSNDGKLFAIRKGLFNSIPPGVIDDLWCALQVILQDQRFVFEPQARAYVTTPSRGPSHEIVRRRRIVNESLCCIFACRRVLNPFQYGFFSVGLFVNKVIRRLVPVCLLVIFVTSLLLASVSDLALVSVLAQTIVYGTAITRGLVANLAVRPPALNRALDLVYYFCLGNAGILMGLFDLCVGRRVTKWEPVKR